MENFILGLFVSCLFIQWNTGRTHSALKSILHEIEQMRKEADGK